jgi:hypothetical protein
MVYAPKNVKAISLIQMLGLSLKVQKNCKKLYVIIKEKDLE